MFSTKHQHCTGIHKNLTSMLQSMKCSTLPLPQWNVPLYYFPDESLHFTIFHMNIPLYHFPNETFHITIFPMKRSTLPFSQWNIPFYCFPNEMFHFTIFPMKRSTQNFFPFIQCAFTVPLIHSCRGRRKEHSRDCVSHYNIYLNLSSL
jgi:hypothetical protein